MAFSTLKCNAQVTKSISITPQTIARYGPDIPLAVFPVYAKIADLSLELSVKY